MSATGNGGRNRVWVWVCVGVGIGSAVGTLVAGAAATSSVAGRVMRFGVQWPATRERRPRRSDVARRDGVGAVHLLRPCGTAGDGSDPQPAASGSGAGTPCEDRSRAEWLCAEVEAELLRVGGAGLLADARMEAQWYVALFFPWEGRGDEPTDRLGARLEILMARLELALGEEGGPA